MYSHSFCLETLPTPMNILWHMWPRTQVQIACLWNKKNHLISCIPGEDKTLSRFRCRKRERCVLVLVVILDIVWWLWTSISQFFAVRIDRLRREPCGQRTDYIKYYSPSWKTKHLTSLSNTVCVSLNYSIIYFVPHQLVKLGPGGNNF